MNFESILEQVCLALPLVIGGYLSLFLMQLPDFSIGSAFLSGAVLSTLYPFSEFGLTPLILSLIGGALVGCCTAIINQLCRIPFLISAIITSGLFHGIALFVMGEPLKSISGHLYLPSCFFLSPEASFLLVLTIILPVVLFFILKSQFGFSVAIFGNNPQFFKNYGISTRYILIVGTSMGSALAGLSGALHAYSNGFVSIDMEYGTLLLCLTSIYMGALFSKKKPFLMTPVIGVLCYFTVQQILLSIGLNLTYFSFFQAVCVLFSISIHTKNNTHIGATI